MTQQPPPGYPPAPQPGYGYGYQQPQQQMPVSKPPTNVFAIISLIGVFFLSLLGIIFGHVALNQIKRTGESGRGLALAGLIIGYVRLACEALGIIAMIIFFGLFGAIAADSSDRLVDQLEQLETTPDYGEDLYTEDMPWAGTEKEAFCTALDDYALSYDDEYAYYEQLLAVTDDPEFAALIERQLDAFELDFDAMTDEEYDQYIQQIDEWSTAHSEQLDNCYAG